MPIDMDNMLPGFSSQLILSNSNLFTTNVNNSAAPDTLTAAVLRDEEILDVGIVVTAVSATGYKVQFGRTGDVESLVDLTTVTAGSAVGTVYRVASGNLSWAATADTEAERILSQGDVVTCGCLGDGDEDGRFMPFVLMRGAEPLDPIA